VTVPRILLGLAGLNVTAFLIAFLLGFPVVPRVALEAQPGEGILSSAELADANRVFFRHFSAGVITGVLTLLVHSIVMVYFIGTGRWIREAVERYDLSGSWNTQARKLKARTFPFALLSMLLMILAATLGAAADVGKVPSWWHLGAVSVAFLFNLGTYYREYRAVIQNVAILNDVVQEARQRTPRRVATHTTT
jgi:hypothetical protein